MRLRAVLLVGVLAAIGLSACGDDDGGVSDTEPAFTTTPTETHLDITAVDFAFTPEIVTIPTGVEVRVTLENTGVVEHYWVVLSEPISTEDEFDEDLVLFEIEAQTDNTATKLLEGDLAPGIYQVICPVPGHFTAGMVGELVVTG
jgi:uncharacterized cupredoxin-like copper-binding protein